MKQVKQHGNSVFGDLANQRIDFRGVQSKIQSYLNYRSKNMRLEVKFLVKSEEIKLFSSFNCANLSYYQELKDFHQTFLVRNLFILDFPNFHF